MSAKIHILKSEIANKIAAGEVVQRPASAVKELVENSLDAGARSISVVIKDAGKALIQVTDDGEGMSPEDALLAFRRHATSKIATADDLENIRTLGFRGEALASMGAVAQVEMKTRTAAQEVGTLVRVEGDEVKEQSPAACERGTVISIKNLFYNTPARRNFLKSQQTERKNVTDVVTRMALAYPEVAWRYVSDDETLLDVRPKGVEDRLKDIIGVKQFGLLLPVDERTDFLSLQGFIGKPDFVRKNRVDQYLYLNRRYIVNRAINHAVFQAYEHLLIKGTFPFFVLNLTVDPRTVDINVHPSKMEVKFGNESQVYRFVLSVIKRTLAHHDLVPTVTVEGIGASGPEARLRFQGTPAAQRDASWSGEGMAIPGQSDVEELFRRARLTPGNAPPSSFAPIFQPPAERIIQQEQKGPSDDEGQGEARAIWQIHNKYILSQVKTGLMIVDQHVAHERILYEKALANFENNLPSSQQLLFPQTITLAPSDYALVQDLLPHLATLGFALKPFGKNTVVIDGIPADVRVGSERKILEDVLDEFRNNEHQSTIDARDNLAKSFACKAAIKAGDKLKTHEMISLIDQLFLTSMPYVCPHGRPVVVKISIDELDRRFGRT